MESLNSFFSSTRKPPRSRISDFLPSNIIDEIDIAPPKTSISNSSLSFKDAIDALLNSPVPQLFPVPIFFTIHRPFAIQNEKTLSLISIATNFLCDRE